VTAGTPAADYLAESRREWEAYRRRKARLRQQERHGEISPEDYATAIREEAQRHGV
jgi:hypothetical protein